MITYEVRAVMDPSMAARFEAYMRAHVRDVVATGCFADAALECSEAGRYRVRYRARTPEDLDRYLRDHTAGLRADFATHFPSGITVERATWTEVLHIP